MTSSVISTSKRYAKEVTLTKDEIENLLDDAKAKFLDSEMNSFKSYPLEFVIDGCDGVCAEDCTAKTVDEARFLDIHAQRNLLGNLNDTMPRISLMLADANIAPLMSAESCVNERDYDVGCAVVDIGHSTTSVVVFKDNNVRHVGVIPFGSNSITEDLTSFGIARSAAEQLKIEYGTLEENPKKQTLSIAVQGTSERIRIDTDKICQIVKARVDEIVDMVCQEIDKSGYYEDLAGGIILTGGGSKLSGMSDFVKYKSNMPVRQAVWNDILLQSASSSKEQKDGKPEYSVLYGNLMSAVEDCTDLKENPVPVVPSTLQKKEKSRKTNRLGDLFEKFTNSFFKDVDDHYEKQ